MIIRGYRRADGKVGIRNHVLVLPTSVCAGRVAAEIAGGVAGCVAACHAFGCCQVGADARLTFRTLLNTAANPNVGAIVVVGLGCEGLEPLALIQAIEGLNKPIAGVIIQEDGGTVQAIARGLSVARVLADQAAAQPREEADASALILGLECGGSDATSGLAANPALGVASDMLVKLGGTCVLSETTESIGAEHVLARRAASDAVRDRLLSIVRACEARALQLGEDLRGSQPTPGNIAGGISSIEEKSLGCIHKAGSAPVQGVLDYGEIPSGCGLYVMDTPGMDVESMSGVAAGGAQVMVFTTGRGTPAGNPVMPVIKVTANRRTAERMADNIDLDLSGVIEGTCTIEEAGRRVFDEILAVAEGKLTKAERLGHTEFSIYRIGPTF
jgi:altronate dehydratase large subunit